MLTSGAGHASLNGFLFILTGLKPVCFAFQQEDPIGGQNPYFFIIPIVFSKKENMDTSFTEKKSSAAFLTPMNPPGSYS